MLEIEIKAGVEDHEQARSGILALGGRFRGRFREVDTYYSHPARDFALSDEALRIRTVGDRSTLTYKGPRLGERSKTRFESETGVENPEALREILRELGFADVAVVRKDREIYEYGDVEICMDSVEGLGLFVELEKRGEDRIKGEEELFSLAGKIGLTRFERKSYLELKLEREDR